MNDKRAAADLALELARAQQLVEAVSSGRLTLPEAIQQSHLLTRLAQSTETESRLRDLQRQNDDLLRQAQPARMEQALRESEERYRALVENANDIIYTHDLDGNFTSVNAAATRTYGYTTEEILRLNISDIVDPAHLPVVQARMRKRPRRTTPADHYELRTITRAGVPVWIEISTSVIRHQGRVIGIQGVARDITERKYAEEALQQSEARLRAIFDGTDQSIILLDAGCRIVAFNRVADQLAQRRYNRPLTVGAPLLHLIDHANPSSFKQAFQQALAGAAQVCERQVPDRGTGPEWWELTLNPVVSSADHVTGVLLIIRNVTERKHAQDALRQSEAHLRAIFDSTDQSIMLVDPDFRLLACNKAAQQVAIGLLNTEMHIGDPILWYITPQDHAAFRQHFIEALTGKRQIVEKLIQGRSPDPDWWEFSYNPILLPDGTVAGVTLLSRNITARKQAESTLQESEERYRQLVERSPIAIAIHRNNRFLYINTIGQKLLGIARPEDFVDVPVLDFIHPDYRDLAGQRALQAQEQGIEAPLREEKFVRRDGTIIDVEDTCIPFTYQGRQAVQSVFYDVTARNQARDALRRSEERFATAFRAGPDTLIITRISDGVILDVNDSWEALVGYSRDEAIGHSPESLKLWADQAQWTQLRHLLLRNNFVREFEIAIRQKSGAIRQLVLSIELIEIGGEMCTLSIARDVTGRKDAEQQLRLQAAALSAAANAIIIADRNGLITWVNPAHALLTGYTLEETIGQPILRRAEAQDTGSLLPMWEALQEGHPWHGEVTAQRKDGTTYAEEQTITPVTDEQRRITHFIAIKQDVTERKQHEQRLSYLVNHDALTGLPNRLWLEQALESAVARSRRGAVSVLLLLDLDNFKLVNDTLGHAAGDELLAGLAPILARHLREGDVLARLGGDEFAVLLDSTALSQAITLAEQLREVVDSTPFRLGGQVFTLGVSVGIVPVDGYQTAQQLLAQADAAMYTAKEQGRNRVALYHPEESSTRRLSEANQWVTRIKDALKDNRLVLHYQPVVRLSSGEVAHYEALLRMREPGGGLILPNEFIPAAERFGLMPPLDRWVVKQTIRTLEEHPGISVVINLSGQSRVDEYLLDYIEAELREHNVCPDRLGFEITETAAVQDLVRAEGWIRRLKALGCCFALDDFGVGFTSFAYLRTLPVDQIKIDGSFIRTIHQDSSSRDIVHAMYSLAHKLGKETVAEFVENEAILRVLKEIGITYGQGFYLGKPLPSLP